MRHANKTISAVLATVLALTLCAAGATDAPAAPKAPLLDADNVTRIACDFEGAEAKDLGTWGTPAFTYALAAAADEGISGEGIDGQVLKLTGSNDTAKTFMRFNGPTTGGDRYNWNGAIGYEFYVDGSAAAEEFSLLTGLMGTKYDTSENGLWASLKPGSTVYVRAEDGDWQAKTVGNDWHIVLDAGFKGWVRVGLTDGCWSNQFKDDNLSLTEALWRTTRFNFSTKGIAAEVSVYVDSLRAVYADSRAAAVCAVDFEGTITSRAQNASQVTAAQVTAADEGVSGEGIAGSLIKLTAPAGYVPTCEEKKVSCVNLNSFTKLNKDWVGATAYEMYVDTSKATDAADGVQFGTGLLVQPTKTGVGSIWADLKPGATVQIRTADSDWQNVTVAANRMITLPAGFAGWVRVSLDQTSFAGGPWGNATSMIDVPRGLHNVQQFTFEIAGTVNPVYVDSIRTVYGGVAGDINNDGRVSTADARQVLRAAVGKDTLTMAQSAMADVNGDGRVSTTDARQVLRRIVGKA